MLSIVAFCNCTKAEDDNLSVWNNVEFSMNKTNLSVVEVLLSADYWVASKLYYYTEPNAKGEEKFGYDMELQSSVLDGSGLHMFRMFGDKVFREYGAGVPSPNPSQNIPPHYRDFDLKIEDNTICAIVKDGKTYSFRIVAYDDNKVLVESNYWKSYKYNSKAEVEKVYSYGRILFERKVATSPDWEDRYMSEEELQKYIEENHNQ